jgi:hypothetical protein
MAMIWKAVHIEYDVDVRDAHYRNRTFRVRLRFGADANQTWWEVQVDGVDLDPESSQARAKASAEREIQWLLRS